MSGYEGVDTAARIGAAAARWLRGGGFAFAARYLVPESGGTKWKALTKAEAAEIRAAGLALMLCWETAARRVRDGEAAGRSDAATARALAEAMGVPPGTVIYYAADYDVPAADHDAVEAYLRGAADAAGPYPVGLYGHDRLIAAMSARGACRRFWRSAAWSTGDAGAAVVQTEWQGGARAKALAGTLGFAVDLDRADTLAGMWLPEAPAAETEAEAAHRWAVESGVTDGDMRDVSQAERMLYRYHRRFGG